MNAAVIEFNSLSNAVWAAPEDNHFLPGGTDGFILHFVCGVMIGSLCSKFGSTCINGFVNRHNPKLDAQIPHRFLIRLPQMRKLTVGEPESFCFEEYVPGYGFHFDSG